MMTTMKRKRTPLSDQIRRALNDCGLTRYRVWKLTGIGEDTLSRFVKGERGLPMKTLDRLADFLDLNITTGPNYPAKAVRTTHSAAGTGRAASGRSNGGSGRRPANAGKRKDDDMATVFYRGKRPNQVFWVKFLNRIQGRWLSYSVGPDKGTAEALRRRIEHLERLRLSGDPPNADTTRWLEQLPVRLRDKLVEANLIDGHKAGSLKPLCEHVGDFKADLLTSASTHYAEQTAKRVLAVFDAGGIKTWGDITLDKIRGAIGRLRHHGKPLKTQTKNHHIAAVKNFMNWMVANGRALASPIDGKKLSKQKVTDATERRAGTVNELRRIIAAAEKGPDFRWGGGKGGKHQPRCITGPERAVLYTLAAETGYRASELASLTKASFKLNSLPYIVTVESGYTKNGETATTPLSPGTADMLRAFLAHKHPQARVFDIPGDEERNTGQTAEMLRRDCEAAGVTYEDAEGRVLDFHALRHTFITNVASSGASIKTIQDLARHADPSITIGRYAHTTDTEKAAAIAALPELKPLDEVAQATGTDDNPTSQSSTNREDRGGIQRSGQHIGQHSRNITARQDAPSFVMDGQGEQGDDERKPLKTQKKCADVRQDSSSCINPPGRARTCNLRFRRPPLYPIELRAGTVSQYITYIYILYAIDPFA